MFFYFIVISSIAIPLIATNKKRGLQISLFLLFILLGFQFEMVNDWESNIWRWKIANEGIRLGSGSRDIEPAFIFILKLFKPITFFGWLMLTAASLLGVLYFLMRRFVPPQLYWITIAIFMLRTDYALLFINSNRQCISVIFSILAMLVLTEKIKLPFDISFGNLNIGKFIMAFILLYIGSQCHSAAYISFLMIPIYCMSHLYKGRSWIIMAIIMNTLYIGRIFFNITSWQLYMTMFIDATNLTNVNQYVELLDSSKIYNSFMLMSTDCLLITASCFFYRKMSTNQKYIVLLWLTGVIMNAYMTENLARMAEYFYCYLIILLPILVYFSIRNLSTRPIYLIALIYILSYYGYYSWRTMHSILYGRWLDYVSIFNAPNWI